MKEDFAETWTSRSAGVHEGAPGQCAVLGAAGAGGGAGAH